MKVKSHVKAGGADTSPTLPIMIGPNGKSTVVSAGTISPSGIGMIGPNG